MFFLRIFIALVYEALILTAIAFIVGLFSLLLARVLGIPLDRLLLQLLVWIFWGTYFVVSWKKFEQTIAMRAWKLKINLPKKTNLYLIKRYIKVSFFFLFFPINLLSIFILKNKFIHDFGTNIFIIDVQTESS